LRADSDRLRTGALISLQAPALSLS
jgi:hypothetical protein